MNNPLLSLFPVTAEVKDDRLFVAGQDMAELVRRFGTPLYLFDEATLRSQCSAFRDEFTSRYPRCRVLYAAKAFTGHGLARLVAGEQLGMDVVSGGELALAKDAGFPMERVYFHGNNKGREELELALTLGVGRVVVDNFHELSQLEEIASRRIALQDILLRISPGVDPHTHSHTTTGVTDSKFGFLMDRAAEAVGLAMDSPHLRLVGLHFHLGSPIYDVEPYQEAIVRVLAFAAEMERRFNFVLREFSPGGGFAVSYTMDRPAPPPSYYAEGIVSALRRGMGEGRAEEPWLIVEPGRAIVARAGVALYRVGARKEIPGIRTYVSVDGGMGDNIRPALYGSAYQALVANKASQEPRETVTISGKFCESGDVLIRDIPIPPLIPGDIIAIPVSGAYSIPMSSNYNANPRPAVVLLTEQGPKLWRRRERYQDIAALEEE
ncbi:MAG: diaminopimelate decarboxylase [Dehalococcoidia bacterium]|jgi:diaminopimelate decarboxylase|nr:diaminopimelate decarboxylase [Dehalococcoidia bacterium]MDP6782624.1 diaminopimelate decarboxylase [Dehalococcoidia bacterium]